MQEELSNWIRWDVNGVILVEFNFFFFFVMKENWKIMVF